MKKDLLIEIGTEEMPAAYVPPALETFADSLAASLRGEGVEFGEVRAFATPRRLALRLSDVEERQPDRQREVTGPPKRVAFDNEGRPTAAALGFAKTQGVSVEDLRMVETERGEYVAATVVDRGKPLGALLAAILPGIVGSIPFPRTMRWEETGFLFARPIRWLVLLLGTDVVPLTIAGVESGRESRGHRVLHDGPVSIADPSEYESALREASVLVDPAERRKEIEKEIARVLSPGRESVQDDPGLLDTVNFLVERPHALLGSFEARFLDLPDRVVITAMRSHQRYFSVVGPGGKLLPRFVAIANGPTTSEEAVREGNERVLAARLADAEFYWNEDRRLSPADRVETLGRVVWQEGMGTLLEKTERLETIAGMLAEAAAPEAAENAVRAARLSKTDLTSEMIRDGKEFTALQGYMGMQYARSAGEPEEVAVAIYEQYLPRFSGDELPSTLPGTILSLADRVDTLLGCLGAGLVPTGSQDPYGLRRQAIGILRILGEEKVRLSLGSLLSIGVDAFGSRIAEPEKVVSEALHFFRGRLRGLFTEKGLPYDVVDAVLETGLDHPSDLERRAEAIRDFRETESFEKLVLGFKRVVNILKGSGEAKPVDTALFREKEEEELHAALDRLAGPYEDALGRGEYGRAMELLLGLRDHIDRFFDSVLVMDQEERIRENRFALLAQIAHLFRNLADLSKVVLEGERE